MLEALLVIQRAWGTFHSTQIINSQFSIETTVFSMFN